MRADLGSVHRACSLNDHTTVATHPAVTATEVQSDSSAAAVTLGLATSAGGLASPALGALADHRGTTLALGVLVAGPLLSAALTAPLNDPPTDDRRSADRGPGANGEFARLEAANGAFAATGSGGSAPPAAATQEDEGEDDQHGDGEDGADRQQRAGPAGSRRGGGGGGWGRRAGWRRGRR